MTQMQVMMKRTVMDTNILYKLPRGHTDIREHLLFLESFNNSHDDMTLRSQIK